ncbi:AfsR/SARP family transcriptional regulator [Amycolatopsis suaedae]|uniref:AfsR/SARP family transcriptional regulator n=1 Tax=Amycolatopsis suaedae TaxID=2510978 RepID=UPI00196B00AD|nr:BTAD domain-containing putative transcriptional regulator [Amycolatopsis suaedae]
MPRTSQRLLAFLGLQRTATRGHAMATLWPDAGEQKAAGSLRTALWRTQQTAAPIVQAGGEILRLHDWVEVDTDELVRTAHGIREPAVPFRSHELLPGWYDEWVLVERERLRQLYLRSLERVARAELAARRHGSAVEATLVAVRAEPLRESPYRLLMEIHLAEGNYSETLATYRRYRQLLASELGVRPSPEMHKILRLLPSA